MKRLLLLLACIPFYSMMEKGKNQSPTQVGEQPVRTAIHSDLLHYFIH